MTKWWLVAVVLVSGCALDTGDEDDPEAGDGLGVTEQAVTGTSITTKSCSQAVCDVDLGSYAGRACFLGGIGGRLVGTGTGGQYNMAGITINEQGHWNLHIESSASNHIFGEAICVSGVKNLASAFYATGEQPTVITGGTAARRCFLSSVSSFAGMGLFEDYLEVSQVGTTWFLGGHIGEAGQSFAHALCFDVSEDLGSWSWGQGSTGSSTLQLAPNGRGGVACGLTEVAGQYAVDSASDNQQLWFDGTYWRWTISDYKGGAVNCFR